MKCDNLNGTTQQCFCLVFKNYDMINGCNYEDGRWGIYNVKCKITKSWWMVFIVYFGKSIILNYLVVSGSD